MVISGEVSVERLSEEEHKKLEVFKLEQGIFFY